MKHKKIIFIWGLFFSTLLNAAIDNRYLPLFNYGYQHQVERRSVLNSNIFIATSSECRVGLNAQDTPLPEMFGKYDMALAAKALVKLGKANPLPTAWQTNSSLIWNMTGKMHAQGIWFGYEQYLMKNISFGFKAPFMHMSSQLNFELPDSLKTTLAIGSGGETNLYRILNNVNKELGFESYQWKRTAFGDFDLYLRASFIEDYIYKCKHIDAALRLGALIPVTDRIDLDNPMPIPFGAYKHYGIYGEASLNCELKDNWTAGFWFNLTSRFAKTQMRRMPADDELPQFGAIKGNAYVKPGLTIGFAPYIMVDDIRDGLAVRGSFNLCWHKRDAWIDKRADQSIASNLTRINTDPTATNTNLLVYRNASGSDWSSEYFSVGAVYDLQQSVDYHRHAPYIYLDLDIPTKVFDASGNSKTYRLTFGFEFNF